jgi:hypothetical protein
VDLLGIHQLRAILMSIGGVTLSGSKAMLQLRLNDAIDSLASRAQFVKFMVVKQAVLDAALGPDRYF